MAASSSASFFPTSWLKRRSVGDQQLAQLAERAVDLGDRCLVRLEILGVAGQQKAALAGLGVGDECQRFMQCRVHLERYRHLAVGKLEAAITQFRIYDDPERHDDAEQEWKDDFQWNQGLQGRPMDTAGAAAELVRLYRPGLALNECDVVHRPTSVLSTFR
jgi:hypothetical protein